MNDERRASTGPATRAEFPTTQWSKIFQASAAAAASDSPELEALCRAYWPPLYSFLRRQGHSPQDAEDLVQGFLARVLAREDLAGVSPAKGRFRTFLLASLRNFVIKQALRDKAIKRGGGRVVVSFNTDDAEQLCVADLSTSSPEAAFDQRFAQTVIARAFAALREEHVARGKGEYFAMLAPYLDGADPEGYETVATKLGMAPGSVAVALHRMRARLRELLRTEVRQLCSSAAEEEQEIKYLLGAWSR